MTEAVIKEVAATFHLSKKEVVAEGVKAFLYHQLHTLEVERQHIFAKYGVGSFEGLDEYVTAHPNQESELLPDLQQADYLKNRINEVKRLLATLNDHD